MSSIFSLISTLQQLESRKRPSKLENLEAEADFIWWVFFQIDQGSGFDRCCVLGMAFCSMLCCGKGSDRYVLFRTNLKLRFLSLIFSVTSHLDALHVIFLRVESGFKIYSGV